MVSIISIIFNRVFYNLGFMDEIYMCMYNFIRRYPRRQLPLTKGHKKGTIRATYDKQFHCNVMQYCAS